MGDGKYMPTLDRCLVGPFSREVNFEFLCVTRSSDPFSTSPKRNRKELLSCLHARNKVRVHSYRMTGSDPPSLAKEMGHIG
jgi:hypothetical protein